MKKNEEIVNSKIIEGLTFVSLKDEEDGGATIVFDIEDIFKESFIKQENLKKWDDKKFQEWVIYALEQGIEMVKNKKTKKVKKNG